MGLRDGFFDGLNVGEFVGIKEGSHVGSIDGAAEGSADGANVGSCVGTGVGEEVGRRKTTAAVVRTLVVVTDANCTLPALELPLLSVKRVLVDNEHKQVALVAVKDTVVHTSVTTFRLLDEVARTRPHVAATTNQGQV